jgi:hypothetical protein
MIQPAYDASEFCLMMFRHHAKELRNPETSAAVIIKTMALMTLAFGIPPVEDERTDTDLTIKKLKLAMDVLETKGQTNGG